MTREEKNNIILNLIEKVDNSTHIYLVDTLGLNATATSNLRRKCFNNNIKLLVVKNTLLLKAFEKTQNKYEEFKEVLKNPTAIMLSEIGNAPAKLIKDFNKEYKDLEKPFIKAAFVEESYYIGADQLDTLVKIKSKEELIGDVISMLQSPIKNVLSQLQSGKNILAGITKTLSERE